jgi:Domain of unknown function (DUF4838)/Carbohydrate family 9 binding domain-like/Glycosyl hydrolase family 67 N-terminus
MNNRVTALAVLICLFTASLTSAAPRARIAKSVRVAGKGKIALAAQGKALIVIVAPQGSPAPVQFAAQELKEHLDAMTGGDFQIVRNVPADGPAIILGDSPEARKAGIDMKTIKRDGYAIRMRGNHILIAGTDDKTDKSKILFTLGTPLGRKINRYQGVKQLSAPVWDFERGTLYGAYAFLEELGVRWFFAGDKGRVIPSKKDLAIDRFDLTEEPHFILRKVGSEQWMWYYLSSGRIKRMVNLKEFEYLDWDGRMLRQWLLRMRGSSEWFAFNHRPASMGLERRYGKDHPEYFAIRQSGKRDLKPETGRTGHLCYTHPIQPELAVSDFKAYRDGAYAKDFGFSAHRVAVNPGNRGWPSSAIYGRTMSLLPHDSFRSCFCPNCQKLVRKDLDYPALNSGLVWQFIIKTAKRMEKELPGTLAFCLAYSSYSEKPEWLTKLPENVVVGLCAATYARTHNCVGDKYYNDYFRMVKEWSVVNKRPMLFWHHHLYRYRKESRLGVPMQMPHFLVKLFRDLADHGNLMHVELDQETVILEHVNRYVMMKALYNPDLNVDALLADYAKSFYGPGAPIVAAMLKDVETRSMQVAGLRTNTIDTWEKQFTEESVKGYRTQADKLVEVCTGTPHEEAAKIFSEHFVGAIERGRTRYVTQVKAVANAKGSGISIRLKTKAVVIDGKLDDPGWTGSSKLYFGSNVDGERTKWQTAVRHLRSPDMLYFSFRCINPASPKIPTGKGEGETVEIFLDVEHNHDSYYWLEVDTGGRLQDWYFEGGGEPADKTWKSGAKVAVKQYKGYYVVEVALPRKSMKDGIARPFKRPWGGNFCRATYKPARAKDKYSTWSPMLRGRFHQPDMFGHLHFVKEAK